MNKVLITCPPMIKSISNEPEKYTYFFKKNNMEYRIPLEFIMGTVQILSEQQLINMISYYDVWIIGDDPATAAVFNAATNLKIAVKWGVGTDNVDIDACKSHNILFTNTPAMFGEEVSDVAIGYMIMLTRQLHKIDTQVRIGNWLKPCGMSLAGKTAAVFGYGNIGKTLVKKLCAFSMNIRVYDPFIVEQRDTYMTVFNSPEDTISYAEFLFLTCPLTNETYHIINKKLLETSAMRKLYIINVSRGKLINEQDLIECLESGLVTGAALEVFEEEPFNAMRNKLNNPKYNCIFGSHNASNTHEAVERTNMKVLDFIINNL